MASFRKCAELNLLSPRADCNRGNSHWDAGQFEEAMASYQQTPWCCDRSSRERHANLGNVHWFGRRLADALACATDALWS